MVDGKAFQSILNWFDLVGRKLLVIMTGRKPAY